MNSSKNLLIISYTFPPAHGIGGRRWVKFAKYLYNKNIDISIIAAENQFHSKPSIWLKDIAVLKQKIIYIKSNYPKFLGITPKTIIEKLLYRISLLYAKIKLEGNYYDKSGYWEKKLLKVTEKRLKEGYKNVLVSIAPFRTAFFLINLKKKFPHVNFIVDFRDPWLFNKTAYGFESLSLKRKTFEINAEKEVIQYYDKVISVAEEMTNEFIKRYPDYQDKFITIPNGYDKDDFTTVNNDQIISNNNKLVFVFTGTFYNKALYILNKLLDALTLLKNSNSIIYNEIEFNFYGDITFDTSDYTKTHKNINFYDNIPLEEACVKIRNANACMLFLTDDINYSLSTKFCEYIYQKKPIIVFSKPGATTSYIEKNNIGITIPPETKVMYEKVLEIYSLYKENRLKICDTFDIPQFDIENLSKKIKSILH